jgi:hypothetical protein
MPKEPIRPPEWWNQNLYSFVQAMPPAGWVWEFMRRACLQNLLPNIPVDAMNPNPDMKRLSPDWWNCYKTWFWYQDKGRQPPVFLPPAVSPSVGWPKGFHGQQYQTNHLKFVQEKQLERRVIGVKINMNRRDSAIKRDFNALLISARTQQPEPGRRMNPRFSNWPDMHILEVWDLRQFKVSWRNIALEFYRSNSRNSIQVSDLQSVRNAYNAAKSNIDDGDWLELAYSTEMEELSD